MDYKGKNQLHKIMLVFLLLVSVMIPTYANDETSSAVAEETQAQSVEENEQVNDSESTPMGSIRIVYEQGMYPWIKFEEEVITGEVGTPYSIEIKHYEGFTYKKSRNESLPHEGLFPEGDHTIQLVYYLNTFKLELMSFQIDDSLNAEGLRPDTIEFDVYRKTNVHPNFEYYTTLEYSTEGAGEYVDFAFEGEHDRFDEDGNEYTYSVEVKPIEHFKSEVFHQYLEVDPISGSMYITGSLVIIADFVTIEIVKLFGYDRLEARMGTAQAASTYPKVPVKIHLYANGSEVEGSPFALDESNNWYIILNGLPNKDADGDEIDYTVKEQAIRGYYVEYRILEFNNGSTKQRHLAFEVKNRPAEDFTVTKIWDGGPAEKPEVAFQLYRDEFVMDPITGELSVLTTKQGDVVTLKDGETSYTWEDLPLGFQYGFDYQLYTYWVEEVEVPEGYEVNYSDDTFTITNTFNPDLVRKEIRVDKVWDDNDDEKGNRPDSIKVKLLADGVVVDTMVLDALMQWTYLFEDLPRYRDGKDAIEIKYTISEEPVLNYDTEITESKIGFTITNTYKEKPVTPVEPETPQENLPSTGMEQNVNSIIVLLLGILLVCLSYFKNSRNIVSENINRE